MIKFSVVSFERLCRLTSIPDRPSIMPIKRTKHLKISKKNKLRCCEFEGKQASKIESTSLCCISYTVLHVRDQKNEWSVFVE